MINVNAKPINETYKWTSPTSFIHTRTYNDNGVINTAKNHATVINLYADGSVDLVIRIYINGAYQGSQAIERGKLSAAVVAERLTSEL